MTTLLIQLIVWLKHKLDEQKTIEWLRSRPDRELRDMGVTRYDIESAVKHGKE